MAKDINTLALTEFAKDNLDGVQAGYLAPKLALRTWSPAVKAATVVTAKMWLLPAATDTTVLALWG
jgi:hypothetical protein